MIKNGLISGSIVKTKISDFCLDNWATINILLKIKLIWDRIKIKVAI